MLMVDGHLYTRPTPGVAVHAKVFLADESLIALAAQVLRENGVGESGRDSGSAFLWLAADGHVTLMIHDAAGRLLAPAPLAPGFVIPVGSVIEQGREPLAIVRPLQPGAHPVIRVALEGPEAGLIAYDTGDGIDAWIRYFFPGPKTSEITGALVDGFRFRIFDPAAPVGASIRINPLLLRERRRAMITATNLPRRSNFRTRWGIPLMIAPQPGASSYVYAFDPAIREGYWTLDGLWTCAVYKQDTANIEAVLGCSGSEYAKAPPGFSIRFVAGAPAYAPYFNPDPLLAVARPAGAFPLTSAMPGESTPITTAWFYLMPPRGTTGGAGYFAEPDQAALFSPSAAAMFSAPAEFPVLGNFPVRAATLLPGAAGSPAPAVSFPAAPYSGIQLPATVSDAWFDVVRRFETDVLLPARSEIIYHLAPPGPQGLASAGGGGRGWSAPISGSPSDTTRSALPFGPTLPLGPPAPGATAITPQGLLSEFSADGAAWQKLILAQTGGGQEFLCYTAISGKLREALLANKLFLVVSDVGKLYDYCSTTYEITQAVIDLAKDKGANTPVLTGAQVLMGAVYQSEEYFTAALKNVLSPGDYAQWSAFFITQAESAQLVIDEWKFDLASSLWAGSSPTLLVIKFTDGSFESLVDDVSRWTLADEFNDSSDATQKQLQAIIADARARVDTEPDLRYFVTTVLGDGEGSDSYGGWNGVIYFNAAVPTNAFPPELAALAAGFPSGPLRAHHLGITLSSFRTNGDAIVLEDSSLFALVLYEDRKDLVFQGNPFDFKVLSLRVRFENSAIAAFSSQVELLAAQLFGETANLIGGTHGNNLVFDGTLQKGTYRFTTVTANLFGMTSQVLGSITIVSAQFATILNQSTDVHTVARFVLNGALTFQALPGFDLFGFGPDTASTGSPAASGQLAFTNLIVSMEFDPNNVQATRTFAFVAGQMTFDPVGTSARPHSLPARFPLTAVAMRQGGTQTGADGKAQRVLPADLGFLPVDSPLASGSLGEIWFGLELTLNFGSAGGLAPKLGFTGAILASWAPSANPYNVAIGLRLPGAEAGKKSLTIMGPLKLTIGDLSFLYDPSTEGYLLRLTNIALSFLGLSFPSGGQTNALLFGDPDPHGANRTLGWYMAYKKNDPPPAKSGSPNSGRAQLQARAIPTAAIRKGECEVCQP